MSMCLSAYELSRHSLGGDLRSLTLESTTFEDFEEPKANRGQRFRK